jgi:hypothetical protein
MRFTLYSVSLPLAVPERLVADQPRTGGSRVRHELLRSSPPLPQYHPSFHKTSLASAHDSSCCRFPRVDAPEHVGYQVGPHRVRTTAQRLWLWGSLQRTIVLCGESLELSRGLRFPGVPCLPAFASGTCRITAAASALLCRTGSTVAIWPRCETYSLSFMSGPNPLARSAVSSSPSTFSISLKGRAGRTKHFSFERP